MNRVQKLLKAGVSSIVKAIYGFVGNARSFVFPVQNLQILVQVHLEGNQHDLRLPNLRLIVIKLVQTVVISQKTLARAIKAKRVKCAHHVSSYF